jgi:peptidoglycan hydrolase-like protein with peptidoglycan-binding domain
VCSSDLTNLSEDLILYLKNIKNSNITFEFKGSIITDEDIRPIQTSLELLGFYLPVWGIDGKFGKETKKAVKEFQKSLELDDDGIIDSNLIGKMIDELEDKNLTNADFEKIQIEKTASLSDDENNVDTDLSTKYKSDSKLSTDRFEKIAYNNYGGEFVDKVKKIGDDIGLDYKIILAIMNFESGINHKAVNPTSNATGLIQFMPFTAKSLGTTVGELRNMSAIEQLDYVKKFFNLHRSLIPSIKSPEDAYFLVFYPVAANKDDSFILGSERSDKTARLIAKQNPMDTNNDGVLSKGEVKAKVRQRWGI